MRLLGLVALLVGSLGLAPRMAAAQVGTIEAKYHGNLSIRRATGTIDRATGNGTLRVRRWTALPVTDTDGVFPDLEPIMVSIGLNEDNFTLAAGSLTKSRNGKVFAYRAKKSDVTRFRTFRFWQRPDGSYGVRFTLTGVELSQLKREIPICVPIAVIVGNDDFFNGISLTSPSFSSKRVIVPASCTIDPGDWLWIRG